MAVKVISDNSVLKQDKSTTGLILAFFDRISDPSMLKKKGGEKESESLKIQTKKMKNAAEKLDIKWNEKYHLARDHRHQHATAGHIRKDIEKVKHWALNSEIDGVMIPETDRTARYAPAMKDLITFLKQHKKRLFELDREQDLTNKNVLLYLGLKGEIDEFQVTLMQEKAYEVVLTNATGDGEYNRGATHYPYSKEKDINGNRIPDPEKYKVWQKVRKGYKKGKNIEKLSEIHGIGISIVQSSLFSPIFHTGNRSVHFNRDKPILEYDTVDKKIEAGGYQIIGTEEEHNELKQIANNKRTFDRKALTKRDKSGKVIWTGNKYLLSRIVRCGHCGTWMSGATFTNYETGKKNSYYMCSSYQVKTKKKGTKEVKGCRMKVPRQALEQAFLREFEHISFNPDKLEKAICGNEKYKQIEEEIKDEENFIEKLKGRKKNLVNGIMDAENEKTRKEMTANLDAHFYELEEHENKLKQLQEELSNLPNMKEIVSRLPAVEKEWKMSNGLQGLSFEEKKRMIGMMFPMAHPRVRKYGITVWRTESGFRFQAEGILDNYIFGDISKTKDGWEMDGGYSGKVGKVFLENSYIKCENL